MSLNNISLPATLMARLYHQSLVEGTATAMPLTKPVSFLGKNEKNILILVHYTTAPFLPDKELEFLTTVLSACGLDLSAVAIVNIAGQAINKEAIQQQFQPKQLLLLDVLPETAGFYSAEKYHIQQSATTRLLYAPSLTEIEKTKQAKSQFWIALKQLFNL